MVNIPTVEILTIKICAMILMFVPNVGILKYSVVGFLKFSCSYFGAVLNNELGQASHSSCRAASYGLTNATEESRYDRFSETSFDTRPCEAIHRKSLWDLRDVCSQRDFPVSG